LLPDTGCDLLRDLVVNFGAGRDPWSDAWSWGLDTNLLDTRQAPLLGAENNAHAIIVPHRFRMNVRESLRPPNGFDVAPHLVGIQRFARARRELHWRGAKDFDLTDD
jgi:hypothetical protein